MNSNVKIGTYIIFDPTAERIGRQAESGIIFEVVGFQPKYNGEVVPRVKEVGDERCVGRLADYHKILATFEGMSKEVVIQHNNEINEQLREEYKIKYPMFDFD